MKREDFIFSIGFQGNTAIVDGRSKKKYGGLSTKELAEKGFFKAAFSSAIFSGDERETEEFLSIFNSSGQGTSYGRDQLMRLFGVFGVPQGITRIKIVE